MISDNGSCIQASINAVGKHCRNLQLMNISICLSFLPLVEEDHTQKVNIDSLLK